MKTSSKDLIIGTGLAAILTGLAALLWPDAKLLAHLIVFGVLWPICVHGSVRARADRRQAYGDD